MLEFNQRWRVTPPENDESNLRSIPTESIDDFFSWISRITFSIGSENRKEVLEHFKNVFSQASGKPNYESSSVSWAESDLRSLMGDVASENAPVFIDAFWTASQTITDKFSWVDPSKILVPSEDDLNQLLKKFNIGYVIKADSLEIKNDDHKLIQIPETELSLEEETVLKIRKSLDDADKLLLQGNHRAALQEALWLLESVATVFQGHETELHSVEGKYFNKIIKDLKTAYKGQNIEMILKWITNLHGYLSSPTGGGVRHGLDLNKGIEISPNEAKLYCNLIRSYTSFLLSEYKRLAASD